MFGKSAGAALLLGLLCAACAHNVPQDQKTGADGKIKGAKRIQLENGEGRATGIVTYPGGDRVDWKQVELPDKSRGSMDIKLQWQSPRPGLQLAFDVFDSFNWPIVQSQKQAKKRSTSRVRTATIDNAKGKYFIRIYAVGRGDAGKYTLKVDFKENNAPIALDLSKVEIPDPPRLAAVPEVELPCDEFTFDVKNKACLSVCPPSNAPPKWPGCVGKCPDPPDVANPVCWKTMPCPNPPKREVLACTTWPPCPDYKNPDPNNPRCDERLPVIARVIKNEVQGSDVLITIAAGSDQLVEKGWRGTVLRGDSENPVEGGEVVVIRVGKRETLGKVRLTTDQISANPRVKLSPPPKQK